MLQSFRFGDVEPQTLTIDTTGLNVGDLYDARIYYRTWDTGDRSMNITFDEDGAGPLDQMISIDQDATMGAWYLSYTFTATSSPLKVSFNPTGDGSFHLSGFSVQEAIPEPSSALLGGLGLLARSVVVVNRQINSPPETIHHSARTSPPRIGAGML